MYLRWGGQLMPDYLCLCCNKKVDWGDSVYAFAARSSFVICEHCEINVYNSNPDLIYKALAELPAKVAVDYPEYKREWGDRIVFIS